MKEKEIKEVILEEKIKNLEEVIKHLRQEYENHIHKFDIDDNEYMTTYPKQISPVNYPYSVRF